MKTKQLFMNLYWELLRDKRLSQKKLAEMLEINDKTFSRNVRTGDLPQNQLKFIADQLGTKVHLLWRDPVEVSNLLDMVSVRTDYRTLYEELREKHQKLLEEYNSLLRDQLNVKR